MKWSEMKIRIYRLEKLINKALSYQGKENLIKVSSRNNAGAVDEIENGDSTRAYRTIVCGLNYRDLMNWLEGFYSALLQIEKGR